MRFFRYLLLLSITTVLGLGSRAYEGVYAGAVHLYLGDVLYAVLVYILFRFLGWKALSALIYTLIFCFVIECSQLYHGAWLLSLRATLFGKLVLGSGFLWSDLL